jgi:hypothetical protein
MDCALCCSHSTADGKYGQRKYARTIKPIATRTIVSR